MDALIEVLTGELAGGPRKSVARLPSANSALVEAVAARVMDRLAEVEGRLFTTRWGSSRVRQTCRRSPENCDQRTIFLSPPLAGRVPAVLITE